MTFDDDDDDPSTFNCIAMDPPWPENGGGKAKRGADRHYTTQRCVEIPQIIRDSGVWRPARNALLWMWTTETYLGDALDIIGQLGFRKCAGFVWAKIDRVGMLQDGRALIAPAARMGLGQWSRVEHEHLLLARRGDVVVPPPEMRRRSILYAPRGEHSAKPEQAWQHIEVVSRTALPLVELRRLEMFSRVPRTGWTAWGHLDRDSEAPVTLTPQGDSACQA